MTDASQPAAAPSVPALQPAFFGPKLSQKLTADPGDASPHGHDAESFEPVPQVIFAPTVLLP